MRDAEIWHCIAVWGFGLAQTFTVMSLDGRYWQTWSRPTLAHVPHGGSGGVPCGTRTRSPAPALPGGGGGKCSSVSKSREPTLYPVCGRRTGVKHCISSQEREGVIRKTVKPFLLLLCLCIDIALLRVCQGLSCPWFALESGSVAVQDETPTLL